MGIAGEPDQEVIRLGRQHDAHIDAAQDRRIKRGAHVGVGHEIGADDPQPLLRLADHVGKGDGAGFELVGRAGGHHQGRDMPRLIHRIGRGHIEHLAGCPQPIFLEDQRHRGRRGPLELELGIAPGTEALVLAQILDPDIGAAGPGGLAVHHHRLAVVAVVDAHRTEQAEELVAVVEAEDLDALGPHPILVFVRQPAAADIVVEHVDSDAGTGPLHQRRRKALAERVSPQDVELDENVGLGRGDPLEDRFERRVAIDQQFGGVAGEERHAGGTALHRPLGARVAIDYRQVLAADQARGPHLHAGPGIAVEMLPAEHQVDDGGGEGEEGQRHQPGDRTLRGA